jgi:hypothetical protein
MKRLACALTLSVFLIACGGGSNKESPASSPTKSQEASTPATTTPIATPTTSPTATPAPIVVTDSDRIRIPKIGVDAPLTAVVVGKDGNMPPPKGPDDVTIGDFAPQWPGLGGTLGSGNAILFGKLDSGTPCRGGTVPAPCAAVFWDLDRLAKGDTVTIQLTGRTWIYTVVSVCFKSRTSDYALVYKTTAAPSLTLLTNYKGATSTNASGAKVRGYDLIVRAEMTSGSLAAACLGDEATTPPQ